MNGVKRDGTMVDMLLPPLLLVTTYTTTTSTFPPGLVAGGRAGRPISACSWRLARRRAWVFAVVVSCFVPWCVLACDAACVPCLACVWRALLARPCCCTGAGTHPLSSGPVWLHGGPCYRPAVARCAAVGCVYVGGGGFGLLSPRLPPLAPLSLFVGLPCLPTLFVPAGLALAGWLVLVV